jgi:phosphoribosylanthranilate isomerase
MLIKVCGIKRLIDAERSLEWGANAIGFNFYRKSPRFIEPLEAARIIEQLPAQALKVGIVVGNPTEEQVGMVNAVQIHGLDSEDQIQAFGCRTLVAVSPEQITQFPKSELVIDTSWGTGKLADWNALKKLDRAYILSGGLAPDNVAEAILKLRPAGVDACSGIESSPGVKDANKLRRFLKEAQRAAEALKEE